MIIRSLHIMNFRSIKDATLSCDALTAMIGPNGSGKSSFLRAIDVFYAPNARLIDEDFYNRDTSQPITISVSFGDMTEMESERLKQHMDKGVLTVEKRVDWLDGRITQRYYGFKKQNSDFRELRLTERVTDQRTKYRDLQSKYPDLPDLSGNVPRVRIEEELKKWEDSHPESLMWLRDEGRFFGFKEVGESRLEQFTKFIFVPAVREASQDATEAKGSVITEIMDLVVRSTLAAQGELDRLESEARERYRSVMQSNLDLLQKLQNSMNETLMRLVATAKLHLSWSDELSVGIPTPRANVKLDEDGFAVDVERVGHGLQRAFVLTLLQQLALSETVSEPAQGDNNGGPIRISLPGLIFGIEEPELYQHPCRQRHLAKILMDLSSSGIPGVASKVQVIFTSHSPLFVNLERFDQIRLIRKKNAEEGKPRQSEVISTTLDNVASAIAAVCGSGYTKERELARFQSLMNPYTCEGFFADLAVLVEGEHDRSAIMAVAQTLGYGLESMGISIIPCDGKMNLVKAAVIFQKLGIPIYLVWDSDKEKENSNPEENRRLLRFLGDREEDYPSRVTDRYACFENELESTMREELTDELYDRLLDELREKYDYSRKSYAEKNSRVMRELLTKAKDRGKECKTLVSIVESIVRIQNPRMRMGDSAVV